MKKYLKNREGVALPAVIIMMLVMTVLAAGLGTYAKNTLERVMYMDTQKQAYYLARAGVETGAYAYQKATTVTDSTAVEGFVSILEDTDNIVKSDNIIYLVPKDGVNDGTKWEDLHFIEKSKDAAAPASAIGYYTIEMVRSYQDVIENNETKSKPCVEISCTAVCYDENNATATSSTKSYEARGFIFPDTQTSSRTFCDAKGNFLDDGAEKMSTEGVYTGVFDACAGPITLSATGIDVPNYSTKWDNNSGFFTNIVTIVSNFFKNLYNGVLKDVFDIIVADYYPEFYTYGVSSAGSLTVAKPSDTIDTFKIGENKMGFYSFASPDTLIMDAGLNVEPSKGYYATVGLYGSDIVVNGDITMAVYYIPESTLGSFGDTINNLVALFGNRYRLGTVVIGSGNLSGGSWYEYMGKSNDLTEKIGGVTTQAGDANPSNCNRIFFNGNVSVKIYAQGGSTETYRIFSSGDICLFNGTYKLDSGTDADAEGTDTNSDDVLGIDLLKFFLDSVIEGVDGFTYGDSAQEKAQEIINLYYSDTDSYYANGNCPIRKLDVVYGTDSVTIDGENITKKVGPNDTELAKYLIQPSPTTNIEIVWGKPTTSGFDKQQTTN